MGLSQGAHEVLMKLSRDSQEKIPIMQHSQGFDSFRAINDGDDDTVFLVFAVC